MYLMIDNYDSFVYNLKAYFEELGRDIVVRRSDAITLEEIEEMDPQGIILSPGPKRPWDAALCVETVKRFQGRVPLLGVCLGHQVLGHCAGATVEKGTRPMHGKVTRVHHRGTGLFAGLPEEFNVTRYHSLVVREDTLPADYQVDCVAEDGAVMGLSHRTLPLFGVQFRFDEPRDDAVTRAEDVLADDTLERQLLTALFALDEEPQLLRKGPQRLNHIARRVAARTARTARHALAAVPDRIALQKLLDGVVIACLHDVYDLTGIVIVELGSRTDARADAAVHARLKALLHPHVLHQHVEIFCHFSLFFVRSPFRRHRIAACGPDCPADLHRFPHPVRQSPAFAAQCEKKRPACA